ncbi:cAMP-specific 3',5'-cyclic phosphodiesterase 4D [Picochlorum sp. SENEW3]|nr:cAMP-specific 3',5'-cyclic phosphodiesterase 4D [Picochlorum sp. SENEW3]|eukprot:jgi/Picre1/28804/NNA_004201.t1
MSDCRESAIAKTESCGNGSSRMHSDVSKILDKIHDWEEFDVFELASTTQGTPLRAVVEYELEALGVIERLGLDRDKLTSFLKDLEEAYSNENPYHSSTHAADVVQTVATMVEMDDWSDGLEDWESLSLFIAAAGHDVGHKGVTNEYHDRVQTNWAREFGHHGSSVNEYAHAHITVSLMLEDRNDFMHGLDERVRQRVIQNVRQLILETDIVSHKSVCKKFADACKRGKAYAHIGEWPPEDRLQALTGLLHFADISNPGRPWRLCRRWGIRIHEEACLQGDEEERMGLTRSVYCAREDENTGEKQVTFIKSVMQPFCEQVAVMAPHFTGMIMPHVKEALAEWARFHPRHDQVST